jgi:amino acid transporter
MSAVLTARKTDPSPDASEGFRMATETAPTTAGGVNHLKRSVGLIGLLWASESSIIGSGWLYGAKKALIAAGPAAVIAWTIGAVAIIILALIHAELGGMFPVAGGSARFPHYAFGGAAGASFGWFAWLQAASVAPIEVEAAVGYLGQWSWAANWEDSSGDLKGVGILVAVIFMAVFVAINYVGIKFLTTVNSFIMWIKIAVPLFTIFVVALSHFHGSNFSAGNGFMPTGMHGVLSAVSTSGIIFALLGFEQAIQLAGESRNPKRDLPLATIVSILIGAAVYIALQVVFIAAIPASTIPHVWADLTFAGINRPWAGLTTLLALGWLTWILRVDAFLSPSGTGLIYTTATTRMSIGMAKNGYWPTVLARLNANGVPVVGLITSFVAGCICFLPFPSWQTLVGFITSASVLMYAGAPLAFGVFRDKLPDWERPFRLPGGKILSPIAFIVANLIIFWSGWDTDWRLGVAILIGYVTLALNRVFKLNSIQPVLDFKAAQWLLPYLIGMGLLTYISDFGDKSNPPLQGNWDFLAVGAFSLVIYFWAQATSLSAEKIREVVDTTVVEELPSH